MSFQAYLDNIQANTGKSPDNLKALAEQKRIPSERQSGCLR
jgi:hypothetical protein